MNKNFFSNYDFQSNETFVSKVDQAGFSYPDTKKVDKEMSSVDTFMHNRFGCGVGLSTPEFVAGNLCVSEAELTLGGNVMLGSNLETSAPVILQNGKGLNLNLNGKKIVAGTFAESNGEVTEGTSDSYAFWVKEGGMLSLEGNGEVVAQDADYSMAVWAQGGTVEIKGGKFYNGGDGCDLIYASAGGRVYIYGGEFHATERSGAVEGTQNKYSALNIKDADRATSKIVVYGGKFYGFNPADNVSETEHTNFVAEGYVSVEIEPNVFEVRKA